MSDRLPWGWIGGATILSPIAAAVGATSIWTLVVSLVPHSWIGPQASGNFVLMILFGSIFFAPLSVGFAIITQIPLALLHARYFKLPLAMHLVVSAALGIALLVGFFRDRDTIPTLVLLGLGGGLAVGLLWNLLVLRRMHRYG